MAIIPYSWGSILVELLLPFVLLFTLTHGLLSRAELFGTTATSRKVNVILSLVFGSVGTVLLSRGSFLQIWLIIMGIVIMGSILFAMILGMGGGSPHGKSVGIGIAILVLLFGSAALERAGLFTSSVYRTVLILVVLALAAIVTLYLVFRPAPAPSTTTPATASTTAPKTTKPGDIAKNTPILEGKRRLTMEEMADEFAKMKRAESAQQQKKQEARELIKQRVDAGEKIDDVLKDLFG